MLDITITETRDFVKKLLIENTFDHFLAMEAFVKSGKADVYAEKKLKFENLGELDDFIKDHHREYLGCKRNIDEDIHYILSVCYQVFQGLVQLCLGVMSTGIPSLSY